MQRRAFLKAAMSAAAVPASAYGGGRGIPGMLSVFGGAPPSAIKPMALGLMIQPATGAEAAIARVTELGLPTCFLSLDGYIGKFNASLASEIGGLLDKYGVTATSAEVVGPGRLVWIFSTARRRSVLCRRPRVRRGSMHSSRLQILPSCWALVECRRTAGLFPRIRETRSMARLSRQFARLPIIVRRTARIF